MVLADTPMVNEMVIFFRAVLTLLIIQLVNTAPNEVCLQCLCNVVSNCNLTFGCNDENQCGPFRITMPFWMDADKPVLPLDDPESPGAFSRCAVDPTCSAQAVTNYVQTFGDDCDQDGQIDCVDYAFLHQNGAGVNCGKSLAQNFLLKLKQCLNRKRI